jgi:hypothetical protein
MLSCLVHILALLTLMFPHGSTEEDKVLAASAFRRGAFLGLDWRGKGVLQCRGGSLHRLLFFHNPLAPSSTTIILLKIPSDIPLFIALTLDWTI